MASLMALHCHWACKQTLQQSLHVPSASRNGSTVEVHRDDAAQRPLCRHAEASRALVAAQAQQPSQLCGTMLSALEPKS